MRFKTFASAIFAIMLGMALACGGPSPAPQKAASTPGNTDPPVTPPPALKAPVFTTQPKAYAIVLGDAFTMTTAATDAASYQWEKCNMLFDDSGACSWPDPPVWVAIDGATTDTCAFTPAATDNFTAYRVTATNAAGSTQQAANGVLIVNYDATITLEPTNQAFWGLGNGTYHDVTFTAQANGWPTPRGTWQTRHSQTVPNAQWVTVQGPTASSAIQTYTFTPTLAEDGLEVRFVATNVGELKFLGPDETGTASGGAEVTSNVAYSFCGPEQ